MQFDLTMKPVAQAALDLATRHHAGIYRKYDGEPYINHPIRVAETLLANGFTDQHVLAAAFLHDCMEDENVEGAKMPAYVIRDRCSQRTLLYVEALTAPERGRNRKARKELYNKQLMMAPANAKAIKCADIIDNIMGFSQCNPGFALQYIEEKRAQLKALDSIATDDQFVQYSKMWRAAEQSVSNEMNEYALTILRLEQEREEKRKLADARLPFLVEELSDAYDEFSMF